MTATLTAAPVISHTIGTYPGESQPLHVWTLTVDGEEASALYVDIETGEIMNVETVAAYRRNGFAAQLYTAAAATHLVLHAPESHRTYEGNAFAHAVGGDSLPCRYGCCDTGDSDD